MRYFSSTATRTSLAGSVTAGATTIVVASVAGFPGTRPYSLILDFDTINEEIVTVTAASGTTLTVTRGEDGTSAIAHDLGSVVVHGFTGRDLGEPQAHMAATSAHGTTGDVVGEDNVQTLTNKTLDGVDNTFTNIPQSAVTSLTTDLGLKAPLADPTFTGTVSLPSTTSIGDVDATEIGYVNGATSNIQAQLDANTAADALKAPLASPTFTGNVVLPDTTTIGSVTGTEIAYLTGVTSNVQTQITTVSDTVAAGGALPAGGTVGQTLLKLSSTDGDATWGTPSTSTGGDSVFLVRSESFTGVTSVNLGTCFTSQFRNFRIVVEATGTISGSLRFRMSNYGVDYDGTDYHYQRETASSTTVDSSSATGETSGVLGKIGTSKSIITADMMDPIQLSETIASSRSAVDAASSGVQIYTSVSGLNNTLGYNSMTLFPSSGTITGTIRIYGMSESAVPLLVPAPAPDPLNLYYYGDTDPDGSSGGWGNGLLTSGGMSRSFAGDHMQFGSGSLNSTYATYTTINMVDITNYERLFVKAASVNLPEVFNIGISKSSADWPTTIIGRGTASAAFGITELSGLLAPYAGSYYIVCGISGANYGYTNGDLSVYQVYMQ